MKAFREEDGYWESKVNFVDDNGVFVGYDMAQCCCERADWFIADEIAKEMPKELNQPKELEGWSFDKDFFEDIDYLKSNDMDYNELDMGGMAVFRITNGKDEKYLHLFNCHNGYYGHGFEVEHGGEKVREGYL